MFTYHVTSTVWLQEGATHLGFHQYAKPPANEPFHDHAPLNKALAAHPDKHVYAAFFFDQEHVALVTCFVTLKSLGRVVLRIRKDHPILESFATAPDDRDLTEGAHMRYTIDSAAPVSSGKRRVHPTLAIPLDDIEVRTSMDNEWEPMKSWLLLNP